MVVGDKVRVTKNINDHHFEIGEEVELVHMFAPKEWKCQGKDDWWSLTEDEFELLNQEQ